MKKILLFFLILISLNLVADDFYINGNNDLKFIYKAREDSLNTYFEDEFGFNMAYNGFSYGMKFIAEMPKYSNFEDKQYLSSGDLNYYWTERYISYEDNNFFALGGLFKESFGSGILLSSVYDSDFNIDTRITGSQLHFSPQNIELKAVYGLVRNESNHNKNDLVYGLDVQRTLKSFVLGLSGLSYRKKHNLDTNFSKYNILSGRLSFNSDLVETYIEANKIKEDTKLNEIAPAKDGIALYATTNLYLGKFTLFGGYKKYNDFDIYINDPPRLNHSDEPLSENAKAGKDEEGFQSEIRYNPNNSNMMLINYSEAWNKDKTIQLSDAYLKMEHTFANDDVVTLELTNTERYEEPIKEWTKETTPTLSYDTMFKEIALHIKSQYKIKQKVHNQDKITHYEPYLQTDFSYKDKSLSFICVYPYDNEKDFMKNKLWIGMEAKTKFYKNSEITLFAGKEKGGKVCRNGVCKYQTQFSGLRLLISTEF